jgi:hypothetical protein
MARVKGRDREGADLFIEPFEAPPLAFAHDPWLDKSPPERWCVRLPPRRAVVGQFEIAPCAEAAGAPHFGACAVFWSLSRSCSRLRRL